jgi:hypothetical protein
MRRKGTVTKVFIDFLEYNYNVITEKPTSELKIVTIQTSI